MARHPASDECAVLGPPGKPVKGERFFLREIAAFLRCSLPELAKFLKSRHLVRLLPIGPVRKPLMITSARGFALAVAHFRAKQGARYEKGEDVMAYLDRIKARKAAAGGDVSAVQLAHDEKAR